MSWEKVKEFIGDAAPVVGGLLGGPAGGAAGSLVASLLGTGDSPGQVLTKLQSDPESLVKLKQMEHDERHHLRELEYQAAKMKLEDRQHEHQQTQETIRNADNASDEYVRHTRPYMARCSFYTGSGYCLAMELFSLKDIGSGASWEIAMVFFGPAFTYMGMRTFEAFSRHGKSASGTSIKAMLGK